MPKKSIKKSHVVPVARHLKMHEPVEKNPPVLLKDFNYKDFKKIADKVPFTLSDWSQILHISERTLQRYAKANSNFPFSVVDRMLQIDKVIKKGVEVFGTTARFISWLKDEPYMLEGRLGIHSLQSIEGINMVLTQLGRIEHGLFA